MEHCDFMILFHSMKNHLSTGVNAVLKDLPDCHFWSLHKLYIMIQEYGNCDGIYISDMLKEINHPPQSVSRMLKQLEKKNCIVRTNDKDDHRKVYVQLTEYGKECHRQCEQVLKEYVVKIENVYGTDSLEQLLRDLKKLDESIASVNQSTGR